MTEIKPYQPVVQTYIKDCRKNIGVGEDNAIAHPPDKYIPNDPDQTVNWQGVRYAIAQGPSMVPATINGIEDAIKFNFQTLKNACAIAQQYNVQLITFPELFLSGYQFPDADNQGKEVAEATARYIKSQNYIEEIQTIVNQKGINVVCPMPWKGQDPADNPENVYDVAMIFKPNQPHGDEIRNNIQFKLHLWGKEERYWFSIPKYPADTWGTDSYQNPFRVHLFNGFPVGIGICYDGEFPEVARCFALNGSLLTVFPTAAPLSLPVEGNPKAEIYLNYPNVSQYHIPAAAQANLNFCSYSNRAGWEYSTDGTEAKKVLSYDGNSIICNLQGKAMVAAVANNQDCLLIADCLKKDMVNPQNPDPGGDKDTCVDYLKNRRPEIYTVLTQTTDVPFPYKQEHNYNKYKCPSDINAQARTNEDMER